MHSATMRERAAEALAKRKDEVIRRWEEGLRRSVPPARRESRAILVDSVPSFLDSVVEALSPEHPREVATEGTTIPREHGASRVRLTSYRLGDLVREYHILRDVLFEVLQADDALDEEVRKRVTASVDAALSESCTEYVLASEGLRERIMITLAHDLRTPLNAMKSAVALILRRPDDAAVSRWAARADVNVDRVDRMIRTLLDVSRAGSGARIPLDLTHCDLVELVHEVVDAMATTDDQCVVDAPDAVPGWWGRDALGRAVENLVGNAVKYGAPGRPITIRIARHHDRVTLTVHNDGSYIPPDARECLFDLFRRADVAKPTSQPRGWGIGLALVQAVAQAHGGHVNVDSLPETGTSFTLELPLDARPFQQTTR